VNQTIIVGNLYLDSSSETEKIVCYFWKDGVEREVVKPVENLVEWAVDNNYAYDFTNRGVIYEQRIHLDEVDIATVTVKIL